MTSDETPCVLETTLPVVEAARHVAIVPEAVERVAERLAAAPFRRPQWRVEPHFWDETERTAQYVLVLDTLNFSFWGEPRWRVPWNGQMLDGYRALAAALTRAVRSGRPILDAGYLAEISAEELGSVLAGEGVVPLLAERAAALREAGRVLCDRYSGSFVRFVAEAGGSAVRLALKLASELTSFRDVSRWRGREVRFLKRAQLLAADLAGAYDYRGAGDLRHLERLTAFADYKVPQVLRGLGVLAYSAELAARVDALVELAAGSEEEIEIRAGTIWAVERLRQALARRGLAVRAYELDWHLWSLGQEQPPAQPYHRTRTIYY